MTVTSCEKKVVKIYERGNVMKTAMITGLIMVLGFYALGSGAEPPPLPMQEEPEVLTRGPVNEAFAEPVNLTDQEGFIAPTEPPPSIVENVPSSRPAGSEFVWVPGYWGWDADRNSYIWVSGCWRAAPPSMYWVPGYWARVPQGWQWVAGFWSSTSSRELEYLPAPPALVDIEPPGPPPYEDRVWVPPCWYWSHGQYIRRPGYWVVAQPDWVWVPSHYVWTPRGYVFVAGHWDYSLSRRGVLFAPVYFPRHYYAQPGFSYSLSVVVDIGNLEFGLFTYPRYSHYYFGDYYDDSYISIGIYPRFEVVRRHTWYDPIYVHYRWRHRHDSRWDEHERHEYDRRRGDRELRPPRTYRELERRVGRLPESRRREIQVARPINVIIADKSTSFKFEYVKIEDRRKISSKSEEVHRFRKDRSKWESERGPKSEDRGLRTEDRERKAEDRSRGTEDRRRMTEDRERKTEDTSPGSAEGLRLPSGTPRGGGEQKAEDRSRMTEDRGRKTEDRGPGSAEGLRRGEQRSEDRVKVPQPPVTSRQGGMGIFRKGPPSRPSDERKTEVKDSRREKDTQKSSERSKESEKRKSDDSSKDRSERGKNK